MMQKIQLGIIKINYILKYIHIENSHFKSQIIFHNITDFTDLNKCSLDKLNRLFANK